MKSLKLTLVTVFALISVPLFSMFLDPVLKEDATTFEELEHQDYSYENPEHENTPDITQQICTLCSQSFKEKNYCTFGTCISIAHTQCLENELKKRIATENSWRYCPVCDKDYTHKDNKHLELMPQPIQKLINEKIENERLKSDEKLKNGLPLKFFTTTMLTFGMIYSHKNFHWTIDFCNSFIFSLLDTQYGISSAQLHTSSNIKIKALGKCLYVLANRVIPAYTLYKSLNKKVLSDIALAVSIKINQPNKITKPNFRKHLKENYLPYHDDQPSLKEFIEENTNNV